MNEDCRKSVFIVYTIDDECPITAFSVESDAQAWIDKHQNDVDSYEIEELPLDACINDYELYTVTHRIADDVIDEEWHIFMEPSSLGSGKPYNYGDGDWWAVTLRELSAKEALVQAKLLINNAKREKESIKEIK